MKKIFGFCFAVSALLVAFIVDSGNALRIAEIANGTTRLSDQLKADVEIHTLVEMMEATRIGADALLESQRSDPSSCNQ